MKIESAFMSLARELSKAATRIQTKRISISCELYIVALYVLYTSHII